jgi:hypothetical protein
MNDSKPRPYAASSERLQSLDRHTRYFRKLVQRAIQKWREDEPTVDKIRAPKRMGKLPEAPLPFGPHLSVPTEDEDWPPPDRLRVIALTALRQGWLFPLVDDDSAWSSREEARDAFQEVLPLGVYLKRPYHRWTELSSDEAMSRLAFAGLGALRMLRHVPSADDPPELADAGWVSDLTLFSHYEVRKGFERYGAKAVFDHGQKPIGIYWCHGERWVHPGDPAWEHAKWAWRCTLNVGTTVTDHLVGVHWLISNYVTTASRTCLGPTHPLRLLLKPFTWRTVTINANAGDSLLPENGFVHRACAFTYPAMLRALDDSVGLLHFQTVREIVADKGAEAMGDDFPWATDALALYEVIEAFVVDYLGRYYTPETLLEDPEIQAFWDHLGTAPDTVRFPARDYDGIVAVLSQFIWAVTGLHEAIGTLTEYVIDPTFMGTKIRPNREMSDVQASMQYILIMALTGLSMPHLMDLKDARGVFGEDMRGREAFSAFHEALEALAVRVGEANAQRRWPCRSFDPEVLETGVSI